MKLPGSKLIAVVLFAAVALVPAFGAQWQAHVGAESKDKSHEALAFLPNEIWIHEGDSVAWTFATDEIHTVTLLTAGQPRLPFPVGCPGFAFGGGTFDGSTCLTTPPQSTGQSFNVMFPAVGNFKLVCLVHADMTGVVHVLPTSVQLPYNQSFYDKQAAQQGQNLLSAPDLANGHNHTKSANTIAAGVGKIVANGGGHQTVR